MNQNQLEKFIEDSFKDGYSIEEINQSLRQQGVEQTQIKRAVSNLRNKLRQQNNQPTGSSSNSRSQASPGQRQKTRSNQQAIQQSRQEHEDIVGGIDLKDDKYKIKQRLLFNRYHIYDSNDNLVLKAKQKMFKLKEDFPFTDSEGEVVFRAKAEGIIDVAGDYALLDEATEEPIVSLDRKYTLFRHKWSIRDPETEELLARVESHNKTVELLRWIGNLMPYLPNFFGLIPHSYDVKDRNDNILARLEGELSIRDIYELEIDNAQNVPKEALVISAIAIDALEAN